MNSLARPRSREVVACSKLRRDLFEVHRPKFGLHILTHFHRCLPWTLVGPAHQRGITKFYPNVRERIDEKLSDLNTAQYVKSAYVPDVTCFHFREAPDKGLMWFTRESFKAKKDQSRAGWRTARAACQSASCKERKMRKKYTLLNTWDYCYFNITPLLKYKKIA